jgi:hypothetical protein
MKKLGTPVTDTSTGQKGMLTLMQIEQNNSRYYYFLPKGMNPKDGLPLAGRWLTDAAIGEAQDVDEPVIPEGLIGSVAMDSASGIEGTITSLRIHINGCFHVSLQSKTVLKETGSVPEAFDVDLRRLTGNKVPVFTEKALEEDRKRNPSPEGVKPYSPRI